jgi:hypothetical protein
MRFNLVSRLLNRDDSASLDCLKAIAHELVCTLGLCFTVFTWLQPGRTVKLFALANHD